MEFDLIETDKSSQHESSSTGIACVWVLYMSIFFI